MTEEAKNILEEIRARYDGCEYRDDYGTSASGNWGHVGRPGEVGGSQAGGGAGFRLELTASKGKKFTSRAKLYKAAKDTHRAAKKRLKEAEKSGNAKELYKAQRAFDRAEKHMSKINEKQKTADARKAALHPEKFSLVPVRETTEEERASGKGLYAVTNTNASRDRLMNDKTARISDITKAKGAERAVRSAEPYGTVRGGDQSRGGVTEERTRK